MSDTDKSELEKMGFQWRSAYGHWEISLDDSVPLTILSEKEAKTLLALITQQCKQARIDGERYGRSNEHFVISGLMTNVELATLSSATLSRLKDRKAELTRTKGLPYTLADVNGHGNDDWPEQTVVK